MKILNGNGNKKRKLARIAKQVASSYIPGKPRISVKWISYEFPSYKFKEEQDNGDVIIFETHPYYYDIGRLIINKQKKALLKTPNNKDIANLEGIAYNSVDIVSYTKRGEDPKQSRELAYKLGIAFEEFGYSTQVDHTEDEH